MAETIRSLMADGKTEKEILNLIGITRAMYLDFLNVFGNSQREVLTRFLWVRNQLQGDDIASNKYSLRREWRLRLYTVDQSQEEETVGSYYRENFSN